MKIKIKNSLNWRVLVYILMFSSVFALIAAVYQLYYDYREDVNLIDTRMKLIQDSYLESISEQVWEVNRNLLEIQLNGILNLGDIQYVEIQERTKELSFSLGKKQVEDVVTRKFPLEHTILGKEKVTIGTLTVQATLENVKQRTLKKGLVILTTQMIKTFFVSSFIFFLIYYLITRHLITISRYSGDLKLSTLDSDELVISRKARKPGKNDELDEVVNAINDMRTRLQNEIITKEETEAALVTSRYLFQIIFEQAAIGMAQIDNNTGNFIKINQKLCNILGYNKEDMDNLVFLDLIHPDYVKENKFKLQKMQKGGIDSYSTEVEFLTKKGACVWGNITVYALSDKDAISDSHITMIEDITTRKTSEERLLHSQKMESIGTLAGGIAHDFNNLLAAILGFTELLKMKIKPKGEEKQYLSTIEDSVHRAKDLVQKILLVSRKSMSKFETLNLKNLVQEVLTVLKASISPKINIHTYFEPDLPVIEADASLFYQVVLNLSTNAAQAMPDGGDLNLKLKKVKYSFSENGIMHSGDFICLTVQDSGCGINSENMSRIYDPFFTTKSRGVEKGTGLGLSIVSSVVHQHKGNIEVESESGKGTTFRAYFPVEKTAKGSFTKKASHENSYIKGNENILFVDDEEKVCSAAVKMLEKLGYHVTGLTDSGSALDIFKEKGNSFDLVITDYSMPNYSGPELIERLKTIRSDIPVLMVSGFSNMEDSEDLQEWGFDGMISKPFSMETLSRSVAEVLKKK